MEYLKDLIGRLGKALRIKITTAPRRTRAESGSTHQLGPVQGPAQDPR
jgi:hypothetical protein